MSEVFISMNANVFESDAYRNLDAQVLRRW